MMKSNPFDKYTDEYEEWFKDNEVIFKSELLALKQVVPAGMKGIEIGIGSGIFAEKLNIQYGIDPSEKMLNYARKRELIVTKGFAEDLPYSDESFDFAVFITSMGFINNPDKALLEAFRVVKENGFLIIAFINKESVLGKSLDINRKSNKFYRNAKFYSVSEMCALIERNHFGIFEIYQTLISMDIKTPEVPLKGYDKGSFIVIKGRKKVSKKPF